MGRGSKNLSKGNRKLALMHESESLHYRMYKAGRTWLFAGIATFSLGAVLLGSQVTASAAEDPTQTTAPATTPEAGTGAGQATDTNAGAAAQQQPAATQEQPAADTNAANQSNNINAATATTDQPGDISKPTTTTKQVDPKVQGTTTGQVEAPQGTTPTTDTNKALIDTTLFGNGNTATGENSATAKLGDTTSAGTKIDSANAGQDRGANKYSTVGGSDAAPDLQGGASSWANIDGTQKSTVVGDGTAKLNDGLDMSFNSAYPSQGDTGQFQTDETTTTTDQLNDQNAISSDPTNAATRYGVFYAQGQNKGLSVSAIGNSTNGASIGIPANLAGTVKVGTWMVVEQTPVGILIENVDPDHPEDITKGTHEQFRIVDANLGKSDDYKPGTMIPNSKLGGYAVVTTTLNGDAIAPIVEAVTQAISTLSTAAGDVGSALISGVDQVVTGVSGAIGGIAGNILGGLTGDDLNIQGFTDAYHAEANQIQNEIKQLNLYGETLMEHGIEMTTLEEVKTSTVSYTDPVTGKTVQTPVYSVNTNSGVATAIANMINSYINGWSDGIKKAVLGMLAGNQVFHYNKGVDADSTAQYDGKTPIQVLEDGNDSGLVATVINALSGAAKMAGDAISGGVDKASAAATKIIGDAVKVGIDGQIGGSVSAAFPLTWKDPVLQDKDGKNILPGQFVGETFQTNAVAYNTSTDSSTTVAYQNVDKSQLSSQLDAIANGTVKNVDPAAVTKAKNFLANPNASQYDVDQAFKALGGTIETTAQTGIGNAILKDHQGTEAGQTFDEILKDNLSDLLKVDYNSAATEADKAAFAAATSALKDTDYVIAPSADGATSTTYTLKDTVVTSINEALAKSGNLKFVAPKPGTLTLFDAKNPGGGDNPGNPEQTGDSTYTVDAIDEAGKVLPGSIHTDQKGNAGDPIDATVLGATYKDANGKTWYKPAADSLASYYIKDGATIHVLYTDKDPENTDGNGGNGGDNGGNVDNPTGKVSIVYVGDGLWKVDDGNGHSFTFDPSKFGNGSGQPIVINIGGNTNTNTNNNGGSGSNGTGTTGNGSTGTDGTGANGGTSLIILPGQNGDQGIKANKNPDGSITFVFPNGDTQTVQPGDNGDHTNPAGGNFKVNSDGTITFTDPSGNSFTVDPNNKGTGSTQPGSVVTNITLPGKDGEDGQNTPDQTFFVEKTPEGNVILHLPGGGTATLAPGETINLPGGGSAVLNPDGTITFTDPNGGTYTINPDNGNKTPNGQININPGNGSSLPSINGDGNIIIINPGDGTVNYGTGGNGEGTNNPNGGSTSTTTTTINIPGGDGIKATKNPDGSITFVFPNGDTQTVQPGGSTTPNKDGSFTVNPDGTITFTDPNGNSYTLDPNKGGQATQPIVINIPTPGGGASATKNSDGSFTFNFPGGGSETVQPGGSTKPASDGSYFTVNPDGTITFNDGKGGTFVLDPNSGKGATTEPGSKETVVIIPGKDGQNYVVDVEKTPEGNTIIHLPNGSTIPVKPGDTGTLPDGTKYVVNDNGTVTFTTPGGDTQTIDPNKGTGNVTITTNTTNNGGGTGNTNNTSNGGVDTDGDGLPDSTETVLGINPENKDTDGDGDTDLQELLNSTDPKDPNSNLNSLENGGKGGNTGNGGSTTTTTITTISNVPGQGGDVKVIKNPDGSITFVFPNGGTQTVQPGGSTTPDANGGSFTVNPDGTITFNDGKGGQYTIDPNKGGAATQPIVINIPTPDGGASATKNPDGSFTFNFPGGGSETVQPGGSTKPASDGSFFTVNPDGTITFNDGKGGTFILDPNSGKGNTTEPGSKETVVILPGKDGQNYVVDVEKTPEGNTIIHLPNGSTIPVKPGDTGTLPDGTKYVVNDNGSVTFTTPNGGTQTIDPNKGTSNITSTTTNTTNNNGGGEGTDSNNTNSNNTNSGNITYNYYGEGANGPASAQITLPAGKDGKSYTITYTKNPDGTFSITMPGGDATNVKPGDKGSLPNGGSYVVLPDGSLSITNPDGSTTVVNPGNGNGNGAPLNGGAGNVTVNVTVNGGAGGATVNTPAGNYTVSVNGDGTYTITAPNGETVPNLKPGATGTLPGNGGSYEVGNGQITITEPGGAKLTFNVNTNGGNTNPGGDTNTNPGGTTDPNGNGGTGTTGPEGNGGTGTTTPGGNGSTPTGPTTTTPTGDAGTAVTTPSNGNTGNTGNGGTGISTTTGEGTATGANGTGADQGGIVTGGDAGTATGTQAGTANQGGAIAQDTSAGTATTAAGAAASGEVNGNKQAADKSALPQTDEKPAEGIAALGLLGGLVSLLGLAGAKRRRKDI
ncbi:hypothetical protein IWT25_00624 [Secundilactobacillus pentosiphilus]|uniref:Gram-positive cocci surface proteins LPxTG domain-containing protein n=1 Tax=Secundilactobacillus pentosiphilus TaxID=1714682 RepID=A0A1Z5IU83_9LACO|nr:KxYKxGKxW signal peptide domain-containing protein [Secundilactobacillus pentosiphilus]GAX05320.1 hypothetical protein IWT25_00624 [Secundilactobacillus pentosiphilus]